MRLFFEYDSQTIYKIQKPYVNQLVVQFFNPKYQNNLVILVIFNLNNSQVNKWFGQSVMTIQQYHKERLKYTHKCNGQYLITVQGQNQKYQPKTSSINLNIVSQQCSFIMKGNTKHQNIVSKVIIYTVFLSFVVIIQIFNTMRLAKIIQYNGQANKYSLISVMLCNIQDFFVTLSQFQFLMTEQTFYFYLIFPLFLSAILVLLFDMKLVMIVWRAKYANQITTTQQFRKKLTLFYLGFYSIMIIEIVLMYFFPYQTWFLLLPSFNILPQILHNIVKGNRIITRPQYLIGYLGLRLIMPLYYHGCPSNIYLIQPNSTICILIASIYLGQILILLLQKICGPRFCIPKWMLPGYYQYLKNLSISQDQHCPICMQNFSKVCSQSSLQKPLIIVRVMQTPCGHIFHAQCLRSWMDVRLQCPSCRKAIPAQM